MGLEVRKTYWQSIQQSSITACASGSQSIQLMWLRFATYEVLASFLIEGRKMEDGRKRVTMVRFAFPFVQRSLYQCDFFVFFFSLRDHIPQREY